MAAILENIIATLDDLPIPNFLSLSDEAKLQLILDIRHRRALVTETRIKRDGTSKRRAVAMPTADTIAQLSEKQLTDLYYALMSAQQGKLI